MILLSAINTIVIISLTISVFTIWCYLADGDIRDFQIFKWSFSALIISCLLSIVSMKSTQHEEQQCDVIIRNNISYIYLDNQFINITGKYGKNFTEESVLAKFYPKQYVLGGYIYSDQFYLSEVR